ncbi:energy transducer TonB [Prosthecochloris vibrioformis]|uniref:Energy transducer TonB n=1 Tax=Prosthecochloris vibrioformis TaxID=1098 RepID=A0A5C4S459_PROVB|nr:energy transducer TonB [Prosthecochloris vibrioformis]TNJ38115.1 energy transducer TonB [Prosthecochloris vibrioformis]
MSTKLEDLHEKHALPKVRRWTFRDGFLDTERIRRITYGNLVLRQQSHLYLGHGVIVAVLMLAVFWLVSANWGSLGSLLGFAGEEVDDPTCYTVISNVTQLPPPPPIERPAPPKPVQKAAPAPAVEKPANVGKVKKVKKEEAPPEQTLATQKEIRKVNTTAAGAGAGIANGPVFVPCEIMPTFMHQKKPRYPDIARRAGIEGKVIVSVLVSETGKPIKAAIVKRIPSDCTVFDQAAVEALMKSTYSPGIQNGTPVKVWLTVPMRFKLD